MGRELKRVPLKFEWPLSEVWKGYINPHYEGHSAECGDCDGRGTTSAHKRVTELVNLILWSASDALRKQCHPYFESMEGLHSTRGKVVSVDIVELTGGLAGRPCQLPFGHDSSDGWRAVEAIVKAAGLKKRWGWCPRCGGDGTVWDSQENKNRAARWRRKEPPRGKGFQIWETVSEGSPVSPVFRTPEELADWMAVHGSMPGGNSSRETWLRFIQGPGWAMSCVLTEHGVVSGVEAVSQ